MQSRRVQFVAAVLVLTGVTLGCFHQLVRHPRELLVGPQRAGVNDLTLYFIAAHNYPRQCWTRFRQWPLWNPYTCSGMPYVGNPQSGLWYPPNWLCWWLDAQDVLSWIMVAHHLLAGVGTYLLCRRYGYGWIGSLTGGAVFLAAPYLMAHNGEGHYAQICAVAWMPWTLLAFEELRAGKRWAVPKLASVFTISFLAAHAQEVYYLVLILTLFWIVDLVNHWWAGRRGELRALFWNWGLVGITTAGLVAVGLLPIARFTREMVRAEGLGDVEAGAISIGLANLFQLVNPFALGGPGSYRGPGEPRLFWETLCSFGLVPLVLAVVGVARAWKCYPVGRLAGAWLVSVSFAFGTHGPVFRWFYELVPGISLFRVPSRILFFCSLVIAILAAAGVDSLVEAVRDSAASLRVRARRILLAGIAAWVIALCLGTIARYAERAAVRQGTAQELSAAAATEEAESGAIAPERRGIWGDGWHRTFGNPSTWTWFFGALVLVYAAVRWPGQARHIAIGLLALCVLQLTLYADKLVCSTSGAQRGSESPMSQVLKAQTGFYRVLTRQYLLSDQAAWKDGIYKVQGYDPLLISRYVTLFAALTGRPNPVSDVQGLSSLNAATFHPGLLDLLNIRFAILSQSLPGQFGWQLLDRGDSAASFPRTAEVPPEPYFVYENPHVLPRAYVVGRVKQVQQAEDPVQSLLRLDIRSEILLEFPEYDTLPPGPREDFEAARIVEYTPNQVTLEAELSAPAYLFLGDVWYPGWMAYDNGQPVPIVRSNIAFRAVPLSAGKHQVVFRFRPPGLALGAIASGLTAAVLIVCILFRRSPGAFNQRHVR